MTIQQCKFLCKLEDLDKTHLSNSAILSQKTQYKIHSNPSVYSGIAMPLLKKYINCYLNTLIEQSLLVNFNRAFINMQEIIAGNIFSERQQNF